MRDQFKMPSTLVSTSTQKQDMSQGLALIMAQAADDRKGGDIAILRVGEVTYLTDYFVIVTGYSKAQVDALRPLVPAGMSMPEMALRFILANPHVAPVIQGMRKLGPVRANTAAS